MECEIRVDRAALRSVAICSPLSVRSLPSVQVCNHCAREATVLPVQAHDRSDLTCGEALRATGNADEFLPCRSEGNLIATRRQGLICGCRAESQAGDGGNYTADTRARSKNVNIRSPQSR